MTKWVSVKDKLPPLNKAVLTYSPKMAIPIIVNIYEGYYGEDNDEWHEGWRCRNNTAINRITYWMPLPKPPEEGEIWLNILTEAHLEKA